MKMETPFPHILANSEEIKNHSAMYILRCAFNSIVIGTLILVVALAWVEFTRIVYIKLKENMCEIRSSFLYAIFLTLIAVLLAFLIMYHYPSTIW